MGVSMAAWIACWLLLGMVARAQQQRDDTQNLNNYFGGQFDGECMRDGFYYFTEARYVICEAGYLAFQDCAPGSRSLPLQRYPPAGIYRDIVFCNVNLVDTGYTVRKQPNAGVPLPAPARAPVPTPVPAPSPTRVPAPTRAPAPRPVPAPAPVPVPAPVPAPTPAPVHMAPAPEPVFISSPQAPAPMMVPMMPPMMVSMDSSPGDDSDAPMTHSSGIHKSSKPKSVSYTFYFLHNRGKRTEKVWGVPTETAY